MKSNLQKALESQGYLCQPHYFPAMYGKNCLALEINGTSELMYIGYILGKYCSGLHGGDIQKMKFDNGYVSQDNKYLVFFPTIEYIESNDPEENYFGS